MAIERVNLDRMVEKLIHFPSFEGVPLYTRVPDCKEAYTNSFEETANKSEAWIKKSQIAYGSPNNIRRLFITTKGVNVHLYQPIANKSSGAKDASLKREKSYNNFNPYEVLEAMRNPARGMSYVITKTGIGALSHPWVASNIEEVYFDWTVLLSEDIMNMGKGNLLEQINMPGYVGVEKSTLPYEIFEFACLKGERLESKFPRLKVVGYIQELARVYSMVNYKMGVETLEDMKQLWCFNPVIKAAGADPNCRVMLYNIPNVPKLNLKYRIREGIYLYDREVLKPYFEERERKIRQGLASTVKVGTTEEINVNKSDIEVTLDEIYERDGAEFTAKTIKVMFTDKNAWMQVLSEMSTNGKKRYGHMFQ